MTLVSRFEADLLRLLHALLGRAPIAGMVSILDERRDRPACLSRPALALIQDTLAKGYVVRLARLGGWRTGRFLRDGRPATGRLWDRSAPESLAPHFTRWTLDLLLALACDRPEGPARPAPAGEPSIADLVFAFFAHESLRPSGVVRFRKHGLLRLAFPDDFAENVPAAPIDMTAWASGPGADVVEALAPMLAARWAEVERSKAHVVDRGRMARLARSQEVARDAFLDAVDRAGRRDLARFFLDAAAGVLGPDRTLKDWFDDGLTKGLGLADRTAVRRSALVLFGALDRLRAWASEARAVGYFDEGYPAAQLTLSDWESLRGEDLCARADAIRRELDPLAT